MQVRKPKRTGELTMRPANYEVHTNNNKTTRWYSYKRSCTS